VYDHLIAASSSRYGLDPLLVKSVIKVESDFDRFSVSSKGAKGLMQLMPQTARLLRVANVFDPGANINGGSKYLRMMLDKFGGDIRLALAAYNAGPTQVKQYRGVPPFSETKRYIRKVLASYNDMVGKSYSSGGSAAARIKPSKAVVYTYTNSDGDTVITDMPIGEMKVISRY